MRSSVLRLLIALIVAIAWTGAAASPSGVFAQQQLDTSLGNPEVVPAQDGPSLLAPDRTTSPGQTWIVSESLLWWFKNSPVPVPLATRGPPVPSIVGPSGLPGILGQPGTHVVLGDNSLAPGGHWGGRFLVGCWLDGEQTAGIEAGYLFLAGNGSQQSVATSGLPGSPNLAVPYFDVTGAALNLQGVPGESIYVLPGPLSGPGGVVIPGFAGHFTVAASNRLQGAELKGLGNLGRSDGWRLDGLAGVRWLELTEELTFSVQTLGLPGPIPGIAGGFFNTRDRLRTQNDFFGGQVGIRAEGVWDRVILQATASLGLGVMHEAAQLYGATWTSGGNLSFPTTGTALTVLPGGIFVQGSNGGRHNRDRFAVLPELTARIGCAVTDWVRVFVGYNFLYASPVTRPGDQINRNINTTLTGLANAARATGGSPAATGPAQPAFPFADSAFWAQGISWGLELQF